MQNVSALHINKWITVDDSLIWNWYSTISERCSPRRLGRNSEEICSTDVDLVSYLIRVDGSKWLRHMEGMSLLGQCLRHWR